jgi:hypothetical protein
MGDDIYKGYLTSSDEDCSSHSDSENNEQKEIKMEDGAVKLKKEEEQPVDPEFELDEETKEYMRLEDSIKPRWYILSARSSIRFRWDVVIIFFAVINALTLPMEIAFENYLEEVE